MRKLRDRLLYLIAFLLSYPLAATAQEDANAALQAFLDEQMKTRPGVGVAVGIVDGQERRVFCAGTLGNGADRSVDGDTLFEIGSITKTFTVLLLEDMVARGEMKFADPVAMYLPESVSVPTRNGKQITLLDLATQTSGLPRDVDNLTKAVANPYEDYSADRLYEFLSHHSLSREPGIEFGYSNPGIALLGHAIAQKTGSDFGSLVVERICDPLGMNSTRTSIRPGWRQRLAFGHGASGRPAASWHFQIFDAAGALRSSANDMLTYLAANIGMKPSPLSPLIEDMQVVRYRAAPVFGDTAMPWMDRGISAQIGRQLLGHAGGTGGYETFIGFDKANKRGVAVLCSQQGGLIPEKLGWFLLEGVPLTPAIVAGMSAARDAELVGVGIRLEFDRATRTIRGAEIIPNSPAAEAGLATGLVVKAVDGVPTANKSLEHCASLIRGIPETTVKLELVDTAGDSKIVELSRRKL